MPQELFPQPKTLTSYFFFISSCSVSKDSFELNTWFTVECSGLVTSPWFIVGEELMYTGFPQPKDHQFVRNN